MMTNSLATIPAWFVERQEQALARFQTIPMPKRNDEAWRFSNLKQLDFASFQQKANQANVTKLIADSHGLSQFSAKFIFANDELIHVENHNLPQAVIAMPLAQALIEHAELIKAHFMKQETRLGSAKFAAWHESSVNNGIFIYVPENIVVEDPIEIHHWLDGQQSVIFPHTLVISDPNSAVNVIDILSSTSLDQEGLAITCNDIIAHEGSTIEYSCIQNLNEASRVIQIQGTNVKKNAQTTNFILNLGAAWARNESLSRLEGEGARSDMLSISVPNHEQEYDQRTFQHHVSPSAFSDLLYKNSLYARSNTIFSGLIFVDEKAHHTDAYQTCRNLLMSDTCEANSMPGLEINADQVKCSHGSTSSQISDDEIYYLCSRGIHPATAKQLIARGFSIDVIERLKHPATQELAIAFLDHKISRLGA